MKLTIKFDSNKSANSLQMAYAAIEAKNVDLCITLLQNAKQTNFELLMRPILMYGTVEQLDTASKITNPRIADEFKADLMADVSLFSYQKEQLEKNGTRTEIDVLHRNRGDKQIEVEFNGTSFEDVKQAVLNSNCPDLISDFAVSYNNVNMEQFKNKVKEIGTEWDVKHFEYLSMDPSEISNEL